MVYKVLIIICLLILNLGCADNIKDKPQEIKTESLEGCYQRYQISLQECDSLLRGQHNQYIQDKQMKKCLSNKGFPKAIDSCLLSKKLL